MSSSCSYQLAGDHGYLHLHLPDRKVNVLCAELLDGLEKLMSEIEQAPPKLLAIVSDKDACFIAGADLQEIAKLKSREDFLQAAERGQRLFNRLAQLPSTTIALIDGVCLGGGLELALACDIRWVSDSAKTQLGLPEVNLGFIPGWGGTQRLPRQIGILKALPMILAGKSIDGRRALKTGLAERCFASENFLNRCLEELKNIPKKSHRKNNWQTRLMSTSLGLQFLANRARKDVMKRSKGHYPAPLKAIEVISKGLKLPMADALQMERQSFAELASSAVSQQLVRLFHLGENNKRSGGPGPGESFANLSHSAVLGAGVMGGGIAALLSLKGSHVRMKDINWQGISSGYSAAARVYQERVKRKSMSRQEMDQAMLRIGGCLDFSGFKDSQLVIEAVLEKMEVKQKVLLECESHLHEKSIICTNTSALSVSTMASVLNRPERFCGLHFFNPVHRMPLVEVISHPGSDPQVIQQLMHWVRKWGKTPVLVRDVPGFLVNRILLPYMVEAANMVEEGWNPISIDRIMEHFGMPMGPFMLADEVGLDVGAKVAHILREGYGPRMEASSLLDRMVEHKLLGRKGDGGFYTEHKKQKILNPAFKKLHGGNFREPDANEVIHRLLFIMINEACRCLEEGVVDSAANLDLAMIMGTGYPPFRGGPCATADTMGLPMILHKLEGWSSMHPERYRPANLLKQIVAEGKTLTAPGGQEL